MFEKEVIIDGSKVRYIQKQGDSETMFVFLHGWRSDHSVFSSLYDITETMVAFDFPGFGGSSNLNEVWDLSDYANIAENVVDKMAEGKDIVFVAHSFGGRVLLKMLKQKPRDDVRQIVCVGVPFGGEKVKKTDVLRKCSEAAGMLKPYFPEQVMEQVRKVWHKLVSAEDYGVLKDEIMKKTFQNILDEDMLDLAVVLKDYKVDLIWGEYDTAAPLSGAVSVAEDFGTALHIIKDADHFPFLGKTEKEFIETFKEVVGL